ncbi:MAG: glycosyltransferase family 1 protein [Aurantimicrobium sp.]|uniref:glycosyltransferase family 4 protein n=1 Tax=Aurantimicrobium sp. TaxID=1930784 RepID=UPI002FCBC9E3
MKYLNFVLEQLGTTTPGGIGRYSRELFLAMTDCVPDNWELRGQLPHKLLSEQVGLPRQAEHFVFNRKSPFSSRITAQLWAHGLSLGSQLGNLHAPSLLAPIRKSSKTTGSVVTIHDSVPWTNPETLTQHGVRWHTQMLNRAYKYADAVITPSNAVKNELDEQFNFGDRVFVVPGAPSFDSERIETFDLVNYLPTEFFLIVGTLEPRKGILHAIKATSVSRTLPLVHIGPLGWGNVDVDNFLRENNIPKEMFISLGFLPEHQLPEIYRRATALIMPSQNEGFGLPLLEAMSQGTPAITSNVAALIEVAGNSSLIADVNSPDFILELANHMSKIQSDENLRSTLSQAAVKKSSEYSWRKSAELAWQLHEKLMG